KMLTRLIDELVFIENYYSLYRLKRVGGTGQNELRRQADGYPQCPVRYLSTGVKAFSLSLLSRYC
ncbi:MAG: hypothetical protein D3916_03125, partial [Candidatus Electrothrix sp. MAN1_4]|nr:hypothetical protein [Candidatus Electrothrix sp. MAN1_4]